MGPSPKISLQPYYAGKVSRVEFHLPHAAGRWGSDGSLQKIGPLPSKTASFDRSLQIFGPLPSVCLFQNATRLRHFTFCTDYQHLALHSRSRPPEPIRWVTAAASGALSRSPGERRAVAAELACCEAAPPTAGGLWQTIFRTPSLLLPHPHLQLFGNQGVGKRSVEVVAKFSCYFHTSIFPPLQHADN